MSKCQLSAAAEMSVHVCLIFLRPLPVSDTLGLVCLVLIETICYKCLLLQK